MANTALPPTVTFLEGREDRLIHRDLITLKEYAYGMDNSIWLSPGEGFGTGTLTVSQSRPVVTFADGSTTNWRFTVYLPLLWVDRSFHVNFYISEASADAGNFRITIIGSVLSEIAGIDLSASASGSTFSETSTTAAGAANTPLVVSSATVTAGGRFATFGISRIGADAADTATVDLVFWGALLIRE